MKVCILNFFQRLYKVSAASLISAFSLLFLSSCGFKASSVGSNLFSGNIVSGVVSPLVGLISENQSNQHFFITNAYSALCTDPVYAKFYHLENDGTIIEGSPISTQQLTADARYSFDLDELNLNSSGTNVEYIVKVEGCNGNVYKRPITNIDSSQDLNVKTTVVANVTNSSTLLSKTLNQVSKSDVANLINSVSGTTTGAALTSLTNDPKATNQFNQIFGAPPTVVLLAKPDVILNYPSTAINELAISNFSVSAFQMNPAYSIAYTWKLDGVVKSHSSSWNYIPGANDSGTHQIDVYVGSDDGSGNIDTTKPFYTNTTSINVNNNILPTPPNVTINSGTPSPVYTNSISVDLATGVNKANCASFSHLAITDSATPPGVMQFSIDCVNLGTQTENVIFSSGDGAKTLYLWAIDNEGMISSAKTVSLVLDTLPPSVSLSFNPTFLKGGTTQTITLSASDAGTGLNSLDLYYSSNGGTSYSLLSHLSNTDTAYNWTVPLVDLSNVKLKLVATDFTSSATTAYSGIFSIDSTPPAAPTLSRTSASVSSSRTVAIGVTCTADFDKILFSQSSSTPSGTDSSWESCSATKNFSVTTGDELKTIYSFTKDAAGNISASSNVTMTLDTTPPLAPVANLASSNISSSTTASFTITSCLDRPYVLVSESMIAPLAGDANWQACSTGAGAINYVMVGPVLEQIHTLYVYAKDAVGNISASTSASMIYDITNPALNLSTSLGFLYKGGDIVPLNFSASDTNGLSAFRLEYTTDGTNYTLVSTLAASATTYNWTVPASNTTTAKIRLVAVDNAVTANTSTVYSGVFTVDSISPTAPTLARTSAAISNSSSVTMTVGSCVDTTYILISETNTQPAIGDSNWQLCSTAVGNYTATVSGNGVHTFYAWAKDLAGNRATTANSITMTYDTTAPVLALTSFNSGVFAGNQSQNITWTLSDTNLGPTPVDLYYSTDSGTTWNTIATAIANTSSFSWATPSIEGSAVKLKVVATDLAGNTSVATSSSNLIFDSTPASIASLSLNSGASTTLNSSVAVNFSASSSQGPAKITQFCLKYNNATTPTAADSCWVSLTRSDVNVTPATSIAVSNFYFSLGFSPVAYTVYGYVKDEAGQISSSNSSSITLIPATPPVITNIIVANHDNPTMPLTVQDTTFPLHSDVYINWYITDANGLQPNSVKLEYTLDEVTWTIIEPNLSETNQSGCTVMSGANGCYLWSAGAPSDNGVGTPGNATDDKTFKIRISALNISQLSTLGTSNNVNSGNLTLIAGNTNTGLNGSASSAIFPMITSVAQVTNGSFAMSSKGELFYIDTTKGLLYVSPNDGIQKKLITTNGSFGVENGSIASTYLKLPYKIGIDYQDNLYVYDSDRIRKINTNTNPMTITTIIGGGANNDMTTKSGTSLQIVSTGYTSAQNGYDFHVLGNGDIWFTGESYDGNQTVYRRRYRFYNHNDGNIYSYNLSGTGNLSSSSIDLTASTTVLKQSAIAYDVNTFALTKIIASSGATGIGTGVSSFNLSTLTAQAPHPGGALSGYGYYDSTYTGLDGNIYFLDLNMAAVRKYNIASNSFSVMYGSGAGGYCPSGTTATSCNALIGGVFVNKQGKLFVVDNGIIRTIDDNGKVQDIFGQASSYGENTLATNARFKDISSLGVWYDSSSGKTKVIVNDRFGYKIKEFSIGENITTIAGTGLQNAAPTKNVGALTTPINSDGANGSANNVNMLVDTSNGYVYKGVGPTGNYVLQRAATNKWQDVITAGAGPFTNMDSDSLIGNPIAAGNVAFGTYSTTHFMGMSTNYMLMLDHDHDGAAAQHRGGAILLYDRINNTIEKIAGKYGQPNTSYSFCADGTLPTSCIGYYSLQNVGAGYSQAFYDATLDAWILAVVGTNKVRILKKGTNMSTIATLSGNLRSMTYLRIGGASPTKHKIWYCTTGGVLREYDLLASTDTALNWTISNMSCYSNYLAYSPQRNSLIFPVLQNSLAGVAEYLLP